MDRDRYKVLMKKIVNRQTLDIIIIIVLAFLVYIFALKYDVMEQLVNFSAGHEKWEIDEIITVSVFLVFAFLIFSLRRWREIRNLKDALTRENKELGKALSEVKRLRGILPICAECKRIRDDAGYWHQVELYVREHTEAVFSHSICPDCTRKLYPEFIDDFQEEDV